MQLKLRLYWAFVVRSSSHLRLQFLGERMVLINLAWTPINASDSPYTRLFRKVQFAASEMWTLLTWLHQPFLILRQMAIEMHFSCLNLGQFAIAGHATRRYRRAVHDLLLQVCIEIRMVLGLYGDARLRGVSRGHLEAALTHRLHRLLVLPEETFRAILHQDWAVCAAIARFAPHPQRWFLWHHPMVQMGSTLFRVYGALFDRNPEFVRRRSGDNDWLPVELTAGQLLSLLRHSQMIVRLIYLKTHVHVCHLLHLRVAPLLGVWRVHACARDPLCCPVILAAI